MCEDEKINRLFDIANNMQFLYEMKYALKRMQELLEEVQQ